METQPGHEQTKIKRGWKVWLVYFMLAFFSYILNVAGPAVAYLRDEIDLSFTESGVHTSALALGMIVMGLFGHFALKRLPEWKAFGIGGIGMGLGGLLLVLGNQPALTLTGLFIMGAIGAFIVATNPAILADEMGNHSPIGVSEKSDRRKKRIKILEVSNESAIHRWHRNHQLQLFKVGNRKRL